MIRINTNFYVKKMQKSVKILFGLLWIAAILSGCTKKEDAGLILLSGEEKEQGSLESTAEQDILQQDQESEQAALQQIQQNSEQTENAQKQQEASLYVHICGAVEAPGVYDLPSGSRVFEAVAKAGGFSEDAATDYVNQAQVLPDAAKIVIPTMEEVEALSSDETEGSRYGVLQELPTGKNGQEAAGNKTGIAAGNGLVNLNTAGKAELCTLSGIGEARADAILKYRAQIGCFTSKEQLMEVSGIKESLYQQLQDQICVN